MLYTPLLPGAAAGTLEPRHVVIPLREQLRHTDLRLGTVLDADLDRGHVRVETLEGHEEEVEYDQLIVKLGAVSRALPVAGLAELQDFAADIIELYPRRRTRACGGSSSRRAAA
jgi:NADH dehydrogenase